MRQTSYANTRSPRDQYGHMLHGLVLHTFQIAHFALQIGYNGDGDDLLQITDELARLSRAHSARGGRLNTRPIPSTYPSAGLFNGDASST